MFLLIALILDDLHKSKETIIQAMKAKLKAFPKELPKLYWNLLNRIEPIDLEIARTILQWIVWAAPPLHVRELAVAIVIRPEYTSISAMQEGIDFNLERRVRLIFGPLIK
jgi:PhoPQ-activated pathogenicity-related protein